MDSKIKDLEAQLQARLDGLKFEKHKVVIETEIVSWVLAQIRCDGKIGSVADVVDAWTYGNTLQEEIDALPKS